MLQIILRRIIDFYKSSNRWWLPLATGLLFAVILLPFNHEFHPALFFYPFMSFFGLLPLLFFAKKQSFRTAVFHTYLYSFPVALGQCFWLIYVKIEGLWLLIIAAMVLLAAYVALFYLLGGLLFRWCSKRFPRFFPILFPALWVLIDYSRTLGEMSFPWGFLGYTLTPILPLSQMAAVTGVWGLTFVVVLGNMLCFSICRAVYAGKPLRRLVLQSLVYCLLLAVTALWGSGRIHHWKSGKTVKVALLQTAIDQLHWGNNSLSEAFDVTDSMVYRAAEGHPDIIIGPESALLCYLARQSGYRRRVARWADSTGIPLILGALHWDRASEGAYYDYLVYNTAFLVKPHEQELVPYRKIKLVPFSEAFPLEGIFPILSRVNLGEADFKKGTEATVYSVSDSLKVVPLICYESVYPAYVRYRMSSDIDFMVHITNDGWFGKTTGPYQHATMARMRSIEHGCSMARCAITGISMLIDPVGRVSHQTRLGERIIVEGTVSCNRIHTLYSRWGDWFVVVCAGMVISAIGMTLFTKFQK